ncbi:DNA-directed RNA polymerase III subunit rpc3 [Selaginella moellendorffii]|uniref:DNA-directed RNA polymerase III subunit rpc3 n=1 Tax=Selaginella moellendorffii TaxID=88036 RepID=UPI000D1C7FBF|nr:DNA-directed RNA polymerase III subunit rpc3 [Selaginella moellendorffii]|eukprot:XP_024521387.1 DNA-directed RNA polymerase III subunit rpc3 [Selaginella moellendorffii]
MAARNLACDLINDQFGELVQKVCDCLVQRGSLLLSEIARFTGIDVAPLGDCLKQLIQHNCVQAFRASVEQEHDGLGAGGRPAPKPNTFYMLILDNVLHRMRFPKFMTLVRDDIGSEAQGLLGALLQHGRLTLDQLLKRAAECAQPGDVEVEMSVKKAFVELVEAHFIERCPLPEPTLPLAEEEQPNKRARMTAQTRERRVLDAAAQSDALRFRLPASLQLQSGDLVTLDDSLITGHKRKEMDTTLLDDKDVIWRVNYEEFIRRLRHQACVRLVSSKCDLGCGTVLACILDRSRKAERSVRQRLSSPLEMEAIVEAVRKTEEGRCMPLERIRCALLQMTADGFVVDRAGEASEQYAINMRKILDVARQAEIEGIVLQRFGRKCCRIFRLLSTKGRLDHKQISDKSLVPSKEAWELLSKLVKEHFIELEEDDPKPISWRVNLEIVAWNVLNQMHNAAWSLGRRLSQELEQQEQEQDQAGASVPLDEASSRRRNIAKVLEASATRLDDAIMLFHDF